MEWGPQVTGIHHQYQKWGCLDPFPVLTGSAQRWEAGGVGDRGVGVEEWAVGWVGDWG